MAVALMVDAMTAGGRSATLEGDIVAGVEYMVFPYTSPTPFQALTRTWYLVARFKFERIC